MVINSKAHILRTWTPHLFDSVFSPRLLFAGFKSRVRYMSVLDPTTMCYYVSEVLDTGRPGPLFMVLKIFVLCIIFITVFMFSSAFTLFVCGFHYNYISCEKLSHTVTLLDPNLTAKLIISCEF